jgi:hypothetical protein
MPAWLNPENVPAAARPPAVASALDEALELRTRFRDAQAEVALAQSELEAQEQADVEAAAKAIRKGESPGAASTAIKKTRDRRAVAERNASALNLAAEAASIHTVETIRANNAEWLVALDAGQAQSRTVPSPRPPSSSRPPAS